MAVNNTRVREIINEEIRKAAASGDACCGKYFSAWRNLKAWRDTPPAAGATANSLDLEYAAAENYMYARWCVCKGLVSRMQMNTLALGYFATKLFGAKMPTSGNPQSPANAGVLGWGGIGSQEGEADRQRCNPDAKPPLWRPVNEVMDKTNYYIRAVGKPGTSYQKP